MSYDPPGASSGVPVYTNGANAMAANLNLGSNRIINVTDPSGPQDAATKAYADSVGGGGGDFMADGSVPATGDFDMGTNTITNMADPTNPQDAATKAYADSITGGTGLTQGETLRLVSLRA